MIGRAEGVDVCIASDMISRRHALFKKGDDGVWTVTDNKVVQLCKSVKSGLVAVIEQFGNHPISVINVTLKHK